MAPPVRQVRWQPCYRIIPSRYPPISLFEQVADPSDLEAVFAIEAMTNDRLRDEVGQISLLQEHERVSGPGTSPIMAAFTHLNPEGDRFTDGTYGVLYAGDAFETALFETIHHHARFMARTVEAPGWTSQFREIVLSVSADLHDLRSLAAGDPALDPDNYAASQALAVALKGGGAEGLVYPSIRQPGGECVGLFYPDCASEPIQGRHLDYHWDGMGVDLVRDAGTGAVFRVVDAP